MQNGHANLAMKETIDDYIHLLPASIHTITVDYTSLSLDRVQERSEMVYSLLKRPGLTKLEWLGGINHFALGPDDDNDQYERDTLSTSVLEELIMLIDCDGTGWDQNARLTPESRNVVDKIMGKTVKLLTRLPRAMHLTLYAPGGCEYKPGLLMLTSPAVGYDPPAQVLDAFLQDTKRRNGTDAEMVVRIETNGETVESTLK